MLIMRIVARIMFVALMILGIGAASAQSYPTKPIHVLSGSLGSGNDSISRLIGPGLSTALGQQFVVENRGGGSVVTGEAVAKSPPDGYTLLNAANSLWIVSLVQSTPYDVLKDFAPISLLGTSPGVLVVHPSLPVKNVKELIALAKSRPGELNYAGGANVGTTHLSGELFKALAGVNIVRIPYSATGAGLNALLGGQVDLTFDSASVLMPNIKSGRLRALAVTTNQPSAVAPGIPTMAAAGLPGYEMATMYCLFAPAKTPAAVINRLNEEAVRVLGQPEIKERLVSIGVDVIGSTPDQLTTAVKGDATRLGKVIKDAGIKPD